MWADSDTYRATRAHFLINADWFFFATWLDGGTFEMLVAKIAAFALLSHFNLMTDR